MGTEHLGRTSNVDALFNRINSELRTGERAQIQFTGQDFAPFVQDVLNEYVVEGSKGTVRNVQFDISQTPEKDMEASLSYDVDGLPYMLGNVTVREKFVKELGHGLKLVGIEGERRAKFPAHDFVTGKLKEITGEYDFTNMLGEYVRSKTKFDEPDAFANVNVHLLPGKGDEPAKIEIQVSKGKLPSSTALEFVSNVQSSVTKDVSLDREPLRPYENDSLDLTELLDEVKSNLKTKESNGFVLNQKQFGQLLPRVFEEIQSVEAFNGYRKWNRPSDKTKIELDSSDAAKPVLKVDVTLIDDIDTTARSMFNVSSEDSRLIAKEVRSGLTDPWNTKVNDEFVNFELHMGESLKKMLGDSLVEDNGFIFNVTQQGLEVKINKPSATKDVSKKDGLEKRAERNGLQDLLDNFKIARESLGQTGEAEILIDNKHLKDFLPLVFRMAQENNPYLEGKKEIQSLTELKIDSGVVLDHQSSVWQDVPAKKVQATFENGVNIEFSLISAISDSQAKKKGYLDAHRLKGIDTTDEDSWKNNLRQRVNVFLSLDTANVVRKAVGQYINYDSFDFEINDNGIVTRIKLDKPLDLRGYTTDLEWFEGSLHEQGTTPSALDKTVELGKEIIEPDVEKKLKTKEEIWEQYKTGDTNFTELAKQCDLQTLHKLRDDISWGDMTSDQKKEFDRLDALHDKFRRKIGFNKPLNPKETTQDNGLLTKLYGDQPWDNKYTVMELAFADFTIQQFARPEGINENEVKEYFEKLMQDKNLINLKPIVDLDTIIEEFKNPTPWKKEGKVDSAKITTMDSDTPPPNEEIASRFKQTEIATSDYDQLVSERIKHLEATSVEPDFQAQKKGKFIELTMDGQVLKQIGEKSNNRKVFQTTDGKRVIKIMDNQQVAWQELITEQDVPESDVEARSLLLIPDRHGKIDVGGTVYYFEESEKLETNIFIQEDIQKYVDLLEPYLGVGDMNHPSQWGKDRNGKIKVFDFLNWKKRKELEVKTNLSSTTKIPVRVRRVYDALTSANAYGDSSLEADYKLNDFGLLRLYMNENNPSRMAESARSILSEFNNHRDTKNWDGIRQLLDTIDRAWKAGRGNFEAAAKIEKHSLLYPPNLVDIDQVLNETILPILNRKGLDPENEYFKARVASWNEHIKDKSPDEIVDEVRALLTEANAKGGKEKEDLTEFFASAKEKLTEEKEVEFTLSPDQLEEFIPVFVDTIQEDPALRNLPKMNVIDTKVHFEKGGTDFQVDNFVVETMMKGEDEQEKPFPIKIRLFMANGKLEGKVFEDGGITNSEWFKKFGSEIENWTDLNFNWALAGQIGVDGDINHRFRVGEEGIYVKYKDIRPKEDPLSEEGSAIIQALKGADVDVPSVENGRINKGMQGLTARELQDRLKGQVDSELHKVMAMHYDAKQHDELKGSGTDSKDKDELLSKYEIILEYFRDFCSKNEGSFIQNNFGPEPSIPGPKRDYWKRKSNEMALFLIRGYSGLEPDQEKFEDEVAKWLVDAKVEYANLN